MRDYSKLTRAQLEQRLNAAEDVAVLWSWSPYRGETERDRAAFFAWEYWTSIGGSSQPGDNDHLTDELIAEMASRRELRSSVAIAKLDGLLGAN